MLRLFPRDIDPLLRRATCDQVRGERTPLIRLRYVQITKRFDLLSQPQASEPVRGHCGFRVISVRRRRRRRERAARSEAFWASALPSSQPPGSGRWCGGRGRVRGRGQARRCCAPVGRSARHSHGRQRAPPPGAAQHNQEVAARLSKSYGIQLKQTQENDSALQGRFRSEIFPGTQPSRLGIAMHQCPILIGGAKEWWRFIHTLNTAVRILSCHSAYWSLLRL